MSIFKVMGCLKGAEEELIDRADTKREAEYLVREYRIAFGSDWRIWSEEEVSEEDIDEEEIDDYDDD